MSRDFIGSQRGRSFKKSQNRDRVTRSSRTYKGILRWMPDDPPAHVLEATSYSNASTPAPPAGVTVVNAPATDAMFYPPAYSSLIIRASDLGGSGSGYLGTPITNNLGLPPSETNLRPDLIKNPDGSFGFFRMTLRVWGVGPLTNPWVTPERFNYDNTYIDKLNVGVVMEWDQLTPLTWPARPELSGRANILLNASTDQASSSAGEPAGFFEFDRQIICYGKWIGQGLNPRAIQFFGTASPRYIVQRTVPGGNSIRLPEVGIEPNYTLRNPTNPAQVILTSGDDPLDNGLTLFGNRPASFIWKRPVVGAAVIGLEYVASPGQFTITEFKREQIASLGLP